MLLLGFRYGLRKASLQYSVVFLYGFVEGRWDVGDIILVYRGISGVLAQNGRFQELIALSLASSIWGLI
jgi:hypothetical protein